MFLDFFRVTPKSRKVKLKKAKGVLFSNPGLYKKIIFYGGTCLFLISMTYATYLYLPIASALFKYQIASREVGQISVILTPTPIPIPEQKMEYSITIPKILAFSKIVDNVSPFDQKEYLKVLEDNVVAQAINTSYPGSGPGHSTYIFAHSTSQGLSMLRKNAVFYLLGELKNDDVVFVERNGVNYTYKVYQQLIVNANQTEYLKYTDPKKEVLILQTCWPIGTDWKRMLVFAQLVK
jgi:LPXTG-site transpeptidase (sortase) family protein